MKAIFHIVAIVAACGAAFFSFSHSNKFKAAEEELQKTLAENTEATSKAEGDEKEIKDLRGNLASTEERRDLLTQSVDSLKSETSSLQNEIKKLDADLKVQEGEFARVWPEERGTLDCEASNLVELTVDPVAEAAKLG